MIADVRVCPRCGNHYSEYPAMSRYFDVDICPTCGYDEAVRDFFKLEPRSPESWSRNPAEIVLTSDEEEGA